MAFARIMVFAIALTHAVGLADLVMQDDCEEACSDDGCTDCMPGVACRCHCPSVMPALGGTQIASRVSPPPEISRAAFTERVHANPDPREILHVPKRAV